MEMLGNICFAYAVASCVACVIHMWRNRKEKEVVKAYAWIFLLMLDLAVMYGVFLE